MHSLIENLSARIKVLTLTRDTFSNGNLIINKEVLTLTRDVFSN